MTKTDRNDYLKLCERMKELARKYPCVDWFSIYLEGGTVAATNRRLDKAMRENGIK